MNKNKIIKMSKKEKALITAAVSAVIVAVIVIAMILTWDGTKPAVSGSDTSAVSRAEEIVSSFVATDTQPSTVTDEPVPDSDPFSPVNETVTAKELTNLRAQPDGDAEIVGTLKNGETALRTGISDGGWSRVEYNGQTAYAVTSYLTADLSYRPQELPEADTVEGNTFTPQSDSVTAKELTNLRALPTTDSEIIGTLVSGDFLERTAVSDKGWSRLIYNGQAVYAVTSYLSNEVVPPYVAPDGFETVDEFVTAKAETNLRTAPSVDGTEIVYTLKNGEYVRRVAVNPASGWSRLEYNGQTVYAVTSYLEVQNAAE